MKLGIRIRALCVGLVIALSSGVVWAQESWKFPDFSATQVFQSNVHATAKVYRSGANVRVDRTAALSTLYMAESGKVYNLTVSPDGSRQCVVMKSEQTKMLPSPLELLYGGKLKRTASGTELFEGHVCKVENVVVTRPDGKKIESKVWEANDLNGVPVKIESKLFEVKLTAVYRDVRLGTPDRALFTPPDKCTPFEKVLAEQQQVK